MRFAVLLYVFLLSGCATDKVIEEISKEFVIPDDIQSVVNAAKRAEADGDLSSAMDAYEKALEKNPKDLSARWGIGSLYLRQGEIDKAGQQYMGITREPFCMGNARTITEEVITGNDEADALPEDSRVEKNAGVETKSDYLIEAEQKRYCSLSWNGLGIIADIQGHYVMAEEAYKEALSLSEHESAVYNNYGYSLMMAHRYTEAEDILIKGYALAPESQRIRTNLALSKAWLGKYQDALETYSYTLKDPEAYNDVGYIAMLKSDYEKAIELFEKAINMSPVFYKKAAQNLDRAQRLEQEHRQAKSEPKQQDS
ncbi:hypothetical protein R50073_35830 [Maricurvus nonylphenolicus]|uniref:tetratricopeptide repeat protein n=1 Tax=Maricurvus nonylphenolicus TaxID=1008307 RepID=UPI0036F36877